MNWAAESDKAYQRMALPGHYSLFPVPYSLYLPLFEEIER